MLDARFVCVCNWFRFYQLCLSSFVERSVIFGTPVGYGEGGTFVIPGHRARHLGDGWVGVRGTKGG